MRRAASYLTVGRDSSDRGRKSKMLDHDRRDLGNATSASARGGHHPAEETARPVAQEQILVQLCPMAVPDGTRAASSSRTSTMVRQRTARPDSLATRRVSTIAQRIPPSLWCPR